MLIDCDRSELKWKQSFCLTNCRLITSHVKQGEPKTASDSADWNQPRKVGKRSGLQFNVSHRLLISLVSRDSIKWGKILSFCKQSCYLMKSNWIASKKNKKKNKLINWLIYCAIRLELLSDNRPETTIYWRHSCLSLQLKTSDLRLWRFLQSLWTSSRWKPKHVSILRIALMSIEIRDWWTTFYQQYNGSTGASSKIIPRNGNSCNAKRFQQRRTSLRIRHDFDRRCALYALRLDSGELRDQIKCLKSR